MQSNSNNHDAMKTAGAADAPNQHFLDEVFERAVRLVEDGLIPETDALLAGHEALRAEVERLVQLARHVAVGTASPLPVLAGFTILQHLGQGGMGTVYLARQHSLGGRPVALKVLPNSAALSTRARARFLAEATAIGRLRHPNIVAVHDVVHQDGVYAYAMEWVDGSSLAEAIAGEGTEARRHEGKKWRKKAKENHDGPALPRFAVGDSGSSPSCLSASVPSCLSIPDICRIGIAIARALAAVHAAGLLHRDVKPSNILLRRDGIPLLADFGLAHDLESSVHTQAGQFAGTVAYAPPEQLRGDAPSRGVRTSGPPPTQDLSGGVQGRPHSPNGGRRRPHSPRGAHLHDGGVDARSDVYALGVTLYHALAGRLPFEARTPAAMLRRIETGAAIPLRKVNPRVPRDLETIVAKAMEVDPSRRYQAAGDLADDLERFMNYQPIRARPAGLMTRVVKLVRRNRASALGLTIGSIVTLALAAALVTYVFFLPGWVAAHVREARLALLDPTQANAIASELLWGDVPGHPTTDLSARRDLLTHALAEYDAGLQLAPFDAALRRERDIVARARELLALPVPTSRPVNDVQDLPLRDRGLLAFLTDDYRGAIRDWSEWERTRDPLAEPDPLVDAALGVLYLFDDQHGRAYPRLQKAVEAFPNVGFLMEYLADAAAKCGDAERARRWLEKSKRLPRRDSLGADVRIHASVLAAEGRTDEAIAAYGAAMQTGFPQFELAALLERDGRLDDAMATYSALAARGGHTTRYRRAFQACARRWWAMQPKVLRLHRIRSTLDDGPDSILMVLRRYQASNPREERKSRIHLVVRLGTETSGFQISDFKFQIIAALCASLSSPPLESLSLNELAKRMEVENMALWARLPLFSKWQREAQMTAWRVPALNSLLRDANLIIVAFRQEGSRCVRSSRLAALGLTSMVLAASATAANGQCTTPPCFQGLGDLPGGAVQTYARGLSADGSTVVGESESSNGTEAFRWRPETGMQGLGDLPGGAFRSRAFGVSADGGMVSGDGAIGWSINDGLVYGFRWTQASGLVSLGHHSSSGLQYSPTYSLSNDGAVCGGSTGSGPYAAIHVEGNGWQLLDSLPNRQSSTYMISRNGQWATGILRYPSGVQHAFRWSAGTGLETLGDGDLPGGATYAQGYGVTNDGAIVVGTGTSTNGLEAFRWTSATGMQGLGDLSGGAFDSGSNRIAPDGSIILGYGTSGAGRQAVIWNQLLQPERVIDVLAAAGVTIPSGWILTDATELTRIENTIVIIGNGTNPEGNAEGWIARYFMVPGCEPADIAQSPTATTAAFGDTVQLAVVATGTGPITYQWRKNNVNLVDGPVGCGGSIAGATTDTLVLNTVTFVEGGNYDCVVTNACGNDTSTAATLTINPPPAAADVNHDGQVNGLDIQALVNALLAP